MSSAVGESYVTLATTDSYALGALVLAHSLRAVQTNRHITAMITENISESIRRQLDTVFDVVTLVDCMDSRDSSNLELLGRPDLGITFTKLNCWKLTQFTKCVYMDADTLVLQNTDDLFDREEFSAAPDVGWPDCFNSGVFVFRPSLETYRALVHFAVTRGSFDGGDQGLLNLFFKDWTTDLKKHLPFIYNVVSTAFYSYSPALKQFGKDIKVIHFIGAVKPWHLSYNTVNQSVDLSADCGQSRDFLQRWWNIFMDRIHPTLDLNTIYVTRDADSLKIFTHQQLSDKQRRYNWEKGQVDYLGIDKFDNIQKQLEIKLKPQPPPATHHHHHHHSAHTPSNQPQVTTTAHPTASLPSPTSPTNPAVAVAAASIPHATTKAPPPRIVTITSGRSKPSS